MTDGATERERERQRKEKGIKEHGMREKKREKMC